MNRTGKPMAKIEPDEIDEIIIRQYQQGIGSTAVGKMLPYQMAGASVDRRFQWCQANRWVTLGGIRLNDETRSRLIDFERELEREILSDANDGKESENDRN